MPVGIAGSTARFGLWTRSVYAHFLSPSLKIYILTLDTFAASATIWIKRLLITLAVLLCGFAIFEIIVHVLMDSEMSSRDD